MSGFDKPNYTMTPNAFFDVHMRDMGEAELRVTLAVIRKTMGYHKKRDAISYSQIQELTGLSRTSTQDGINAAIEHGYIRRAGIGKRGVNIFELVVKDDQSTNATSTGSLTLPVTSSPTLLTKETEKKSKKESKPRAKSPEVVASKSVRYPDNIWTWQQLHIDAYYAEHAADLDALACAWDKMYKRFTELPLVEERSGVEVYKELCRQGIAPTEYSALITHTRRARTWQDRIRIGDLMRELSSFKAKARRSNIISLDPSMDLNKPVDITPILMRGTEEEAS